MKKIFQPKNQNKNFYLIKEIQWSNKAMKLNQLNAKLNNINNIQSKNAIKEDLWNKRFIYNKMQNYDSSKDKNVIAGITKNEEMNCYHNALKKNEILKKNYYQINQNRKKLAEEFNKTKIKIRLNPLGKFIKKTKIMHNSFSTNNINSHSNRKLISDLMRNQNRIKNQLLNNENNSPDKLIKIWKDLCILEPYRELFNLLITQLSYKSREDFCQREFNELYELKNNLQFLSMSVYYRIKTLENLSSLNDKLGDLLQNKKADSNEVTLKKISKNIENLREYTINICFLMQKIKSKINEGYLWGKYDLNAISEKFKFDKNYLIKMKDELCVLKEGYIKYFFNICDNDLFLVNTSEPEDKKQSDPFMHYVPLSNKMKDNINQCIYIIYQELIGYQNSNVFENNFRNISPLKNYTYNEMDIKTYKKYNESLNSSINNSLYNSSNNNILFNKNNKLSPVRTICSGINKSNNKNNSINNKRILSGNDKENSNINKLFNKINNNMNKPEEKVDENNNKDIKDLIEKKNIKNINIEIDINNKNISMNDKDKEEEKKITKESLKEKKINNEEYNGDINNISNIKKDEIVSKSEKDDFDFNNDLINIKEKEENNSNFDINKNKENEKVDEQSIKESNIINNKLEEIIEEEKIIKNESINPTKNNDDIIDDNINSDKNEEIKEENNEKNDKEVDHNANIENNNNNINEENEKIKDNESLSFESLNEREKTENEEKKEIEMKDIKPNINKESIQIIKSKNLKINIFTEDIGSFYKDIYKHYYSSIPEIIKNMFQIKEEINYKILNGFSPYILLVNKNNDNTEDINNIKNFKEDIMGICAFNFKFKNSIIKLMVNHISTNSIIKEESIANNKENQSNIDINLLEQIKQIFKAIISYIKKNFYFDEIIIGYNSAQVNNSLLNIFLEDLNFVVVDENENEKDNMKLERSINEKSNKIIYTNDSTKNRVDDLIRQSIQKYMGNNILDIFNCLLITNKKEYINLEKNIDGNLVNNALTKYLINKKEISNINKLYNKISNLDQLIKLFQNNNINNKEEMPLSLAENIYGITSTVINKAIVNNYFNNTNFFNNYNNNNANSFIDKNNNIYYNYIKGEKILIIKNDEYNLNFYHLLKNNLCLFFCALNDEFNSYLKKSIIYTQINDVYKKTLKKNKNFVIKEKIIWIPCFQKYKHIKTLNNNVSGTIHEYIKISNPIIKGVHREFLKINNNENNNKEINMMKIEPDLDRDFILDNDFIFGIINNAEILNEKFYKKNIMNENIDEESISEDIEGELNININEPYIIFMSYVKKSDFIVDNL